MKQLLLLTLLLFSSMSFPQKELQAASNIDSFIDLFIVDERGENVFDPKYQGLNNLEVLIPKGKRFIKFYDPKSYAPKGYTMNPDYSIRIFLNFPPINANYSITYIRFNENKVIKIKTEFKISKPEKTDTLFYGGGSISKEKIWFNDKLIWELSSDTTVPSVKITSF